MSQANSFLGNMQTTIVGEVVCLTKYEIDANTKGGALWVSTPNSGMNPDVLGNELIKIKMPFAMFDQQKAKLEMKEISFPGKFEILAQIAVGGGNKASFTALSMRPYIEVDADGVIHGPAAKAGGIPPVAGEAASKPKA